jgi:hypothetical protein
MNDPLTVTNDYMSPHAATLAEVGAMLHKTARFCFDEAEIVEARQRDAERKQAEKDRADDRAKKAKQRENARQRTNESAFPLERKSA